MLSYINLGKEGVRLGNQLFQYAFLRTQAEKLGTEFYCPKWIGDEIFDLCDQELREYDLIKTKNEIKNFYAEGPGVSFRRKPVLINDNTNISGSFESEKCFNKVAVRQWYRFNEEKFSSVREKYRDIDFSNTIAIHLRLGDKFHDELIKKLFYVPRKKYYHRALKLISKLNSIAKGGVLNGKKNINRTIVVFSDDIDLAKKYFAKFDNLIFIEGNTDWEDFYLMSRCHDIVCSASTFSWWAGYLNQNHGKTVVFPKECLWRPNFFKHEKDLIPETWIKVSALYPIIDNSMFIRYIVAPIKYLRKKF
jgi:hypothetical protein